MSRLDRRGEKGGRRRQKRKTKKKGRRRGGEKLAFRRLRCAARWVRGMHAAETQGAESGKKGGEEKKKRGKFNQKKSSL